MRIHIKLKKNLKEYEKAHIGLSTIKRTGRLCEDVWENLL